MNRPDWRDPNAYPSPEGTPLSKWAWEFLRRNPDYQKDYHEINDLDGLDALIFTPPATPGESLNDYEKRMRKDGHETWEFVSRATLKAKKWGLKEMISPAEEWGFSFETSVLTETWGCSTRDPNKVAFVFDLSWPIGPQLRHVKRALQIKQKITGKPKQARKQVAHFPSYLRLLDAKEKEITTADMARVIFPEIDNFDPSYSGNKKVIAGLKAAHEISENDFLYLPLISTPPDEITDSDVENQKKMIAIQKILQDR
ncbi:MAG: hypothetical protein HQL52_19305 [Magnetococcales bacterium]|nr:hypothetical protein [Magnetococcales bacterium]